MKKIILVAGLAVMSCVTSASHAQTLPPEQQRLKQLLEQKYSSPRSTEGPATRGLSRPSNQPAVKSAPPARRLDPKDFYVVKPDGSVQSAPTPAPVGPGKVRGSAFEEPPPGMWARVKAWLGLDKPSEGSGSQISADATRAFGATPRTRSLTPPGSTRPVVQAQLAVQKDSYVIRLKPNVTSEQIDALLEKYNLEVTKAVPVLGLLHVTPAAPRSATRSLAPSAADSRKPETLSEALAPQIIIDLRNEPAVGSAFVNSTVAPKTIPPHVDTKTQSGDTVFGWHWRSGAVDDGNWGHKMMRLPPVWTILNAVRTAHPERGRTPNVFLDTGFGVHSHLTYHSIEGGLPVNPPTADCAYSHGTHVAGIAGALHGAGRGIDGIVPDAIIDAVPISSELWVEGVSEGVQDQSQRISTLYAEAITDLAQYLLSSHPLPPGQRRVVNVSLAYNWVNAGATLAGNSIAEESLKAHVLAQADLLRFVANMTADQVLFVAAAGNDSEGQEQPMHAKWFTPFAFAATHSSATFQPVPNILVVEAIDRTGSLASFSNTGGQVSAPGVNIMSTLAGPSDTYGLCSGTSQAAPHVAALAAMLFEIDPTRSPAEVARIIRESAVSSGEDGRAPRIDAFEAVLRLAPDTLRYIVDLNGDENVDSGDLEIFKQHLIQIMEADAGGAAISTDLNGDGNINDDERCWPLIDFNGSGKVSLDAADARPVRGALRSDLDVLRLAWTDQATDFDAALVATGVDKLVEQWKASSGPRSNLVAAAGIPSRGGMAVACQ